VGRGRVDVVFFVCLVFVVVGIFSLVFFGWFSVWYIFFWCVLCGF